MTFLSMTSLSMTIHRAVMQRTETVDDYAGPTGRPANVDV